MILVDRSARSKYRISGADRQTFLQRMLTNAIETLAPGQGTRAELLDPKGKVLGDFRLYVFDDHLLVDGETEFADDAMGRLKMFVLRDDVVIEDVTSQWGLLTILGGTEWGKGLERYHHHSETIAGQAVVIVAGNPGIDVWVPSGAVERVRAELEIAEGTLEQYERARIEAGVPRQGAELIDGVLPLEAGLLGEAIIEKGCYPGQEVIIRILHRGKTNRVLARLKLGQPVTAGAGLEADGKKVGFVTSAVEDAALGIVRREHAEAGTMLAVEGGGEAEVLPLH